MNANRPPNGTRVSRRRKSYLLFGAKLRKEIKQSYWLGFADGWTDAKRAGGEDL